MKIRTAPRYGTFLSALLVSLFLLATSMPAQAADYVSVAKDGSNVRSGPSTRDTVLWEVFKGFPFKVLSRKNDWVEVVDFEGDKGWIYAPLVSSTKTVIVKVDTANMRSGPGTDNDIIATVKKGVVFTPLAHDDSWVKLSYKDEITGWMHSSLVWPSNP